MDKGNKGDKGRMHRDLTGYIMLFMIFIFSILMQSARAEDMPASPAYAANPPSSESAEPTQSPPVPVVINTPPPPLSESAPSNSNAAVPPPADLQSPSSAAVIGSTGPADGGSIPPPPFVSTPAVPNAQSGPPIVQSPQSLTQPPGAPPALQSDASQFQNWLHTNSQNQNVPPPPISTVSSGPPKRIVVVRHKHRAIQMQTGPDAPLVQTPRPLSYAQSQAIMLKSTPAAPPPSEEAQIAFSNMTKQNVPLTPQQVVQLRQLIDKSQRAASIPANVPPKPVSTTVMINLAPGATPPAIRLAQGYVSSLVFVDSTGSPWPIASFDIGDPKAINPQWDGKSNILLMQAITPYSEGNLVVRLIGLPTPITLVIVSGQRVVDYRTDIHVAGLGPNSKELPTGTPLPNSASQLLLSVLDGIAPPGSKQMVVKGGDCQAWVLGDKMYLRTRLTVLSPGWVGRMTSPDGMMAYEIQKTSSVLVSQYGNPIELKIEDA